MPSSAFNAIVQLVDDLSTDERLQLINILSESLRTHGGKGSRRQSMMKIQITQGSIDHSYLRVSRLLARGFLPSDAIGEPHEEVGAGRSIFLHFDGLDGVTETDISPKRSLRHRGVVRAFFEKNRVKAGDYVVVEKIADREYRVYPMKSEDKVT